MAKLDRTYASAQSDDAFVMVRRGSAVGHRVAIEFRQIGTSAPATWASSQSASLTAAGT